MIIKYIYTCTYRCVYIYTHGYIYILNISGNIKICHECMNMQKYCKNPPNFRDVSQRSSYLISASTPHLLDVWRWVNPLVKPWSH